MPDTVHTASERALELARANQTIRSASNLLASTSDLDGFVRFVFEEAMRQIGATDGIVLLLEGDHLRAVHRKFAGDPEGSIAALTGEPFPVDSTRGWQMFVEAHRPVVFEVDRDASIFSPGQAEWHRERGNKIVASVPIVVRNEPFGYFGFALKGAFISQAKLELIQALADQAGLALQISGVASLDKAAALAQEQKRVAEERVAELAKANNALQEATDALASTQGIEDVVPAVLRIIAEAFDSKSTGFYEYEPNGLIYLRFHLVGQQVFSAQELLTEERLQMYDVPRALANGFSVDDAYLGTPFRQRRRASIVDHEAGTSRPDFDAWTRDNGWAMELNVPLVAGSDSFGALVLSREKERPYSPVEVELAEALVKQLSLAVQASRVAATSQAQAVAATIAAERERAAQDRALELSKANTALRDTLASLVHTTEPRDFIRFALQEITRQAQAIAAHLFTYCTDTNRLQLIGSVREGEFFADGCDDDPVEFKQGFPADVTEAYRVLCEQYGVVWSTTDEPSELIWPFTIPWHQRMRHIAHAGLALLAGDQPVGFLGLAFDDRTELSDAQLQLVVALSQQVALSMKLVQLADESKAAAIARELDVSAHRHAAELERINRLLLENSQSMALARTPEAIFETFLFHAVKAVQGSVGAILRHVQGTEHEFMALVQGDEVIARAHWKDLPMVLKNRSITRKDRHRVLARVMKGEDVWLPVDARFADSAPEAAAYHERNSTRSVVLWPYWIGGEVSGYLEIAFKGLVPLQPEQREALRALSSQASLALQLNAMTAQVEQATIVRERDTAAQERAAELANANRVLSQVNARLSKESDYDAALSFILLEISHFIGADAAMISRFDPVARVYRFACLTLDGHVSSVVPPDLQAEFDESYVAKTMPDVGPDILTVRIGTAEQTKLPCLAWHKRRGHKVVVQCGLFRDGAPLGLLGVGFITDLTLSKTTMEMFNGLAQQATLALQLGRLANEDKLRAVAREQEQAVAEERARIAREIHDTLAQSFSGILLQLRAMESAQARSDVENSRLHAERAAEFAQFGLTQARRSLSALRPAELEGRSLREALRLIGKTFAKRSDIQVSLQLDDDVLTRPEDEAELLRIVQESVANASKHSGAKRISIVLRNAVKRGAELCVIDDGRGFDPDAATEGFGLIGMRERAQRIGATIELESGALGTTLCVLLPERDARQ